MKVKGMINTHSMHKDVNGCTKRFSVKPFKGEKLGDRGLSSRNIIKRT